MLTLTVYIHSSFTFALGSMKTTQVVLTRNMRSLHPTSAFMHEVSFVIFSKNIENVAANRNQI